MSQPRKFWRVALDAIPVAAPREVPVVRATDKHVWVENLNGLVSRMPAKGEQAEYYPTKKDALARAYEISCHALEDSAAKTNQLRHCVNDLFEELRREGGLVEEAEPPTGAGAPSFPFEPFAKDEAAG